MGFKKGLGLPELLIAMSILAAVGLVLGSIYISHSRLFNKQTSLIDVATQNKLALEEMKTTIRESQSLVASCCTPTETTGSQELILQIWPLNASGEPTDTISGYDYIIYKRDPSDSTKLLKKVVPVTGSSRPTLSKIIANHIGSNANDLNFNYGADPLTATEVNITLTTSQTIAKQTQSTTHTLKAVLRNK